MSPLSRKSNTFASKSWSFVTMPPPHSTVCYVAEIVCFRLVTKMMLAKKKTIMYLCKLFVFNKSFLKFSLFHWCFLHSILPLLWAPINLFFQLHLSSEIFMLNAFEFLMYKKRIKMIIHRFLLNQWSVKFLRLIINEDIVLFFLHRRIQLNVLRKSVFIEIFDR
jgi:hypothetical protein